MDTVSNDEIWEFGRFAADPSVLGLEHEGLPVDIPPRQFSLLMALLRRSGQCVDKDTLLQNVWGTIHLTEGVIKTAVSELRTLLKDDPRQPQWVETVPRKGYRFIGAVQRRARPAAPAVPLLPQEATSDPPAGNLPPYSAPLIGRDAEVAALIDAVKNNALVTVLGPGGVGKTSLARAVAAALRDQSRLAPWWVELAALPGAQADEGAVTAAVASALRLPIADLQPQALAQSLRATRGLLILDNAEHVLAAAQGVVAALVSGAPQWRVLVTSQVPLGLTGEQQFPLAPLAVSDLSEGDSEGLEEQPAVQLFVQRVAERLPGFTLAPRHRPSVLAVCRALEGLPLSLELAAARVPMLGVHGLAERLVGGDDAAPQQLDWVRAPGRVAPERQRSLEQTVAWSVDMLEALQRAALTAMAVFRGGLSPRVAVGVARNSGARSEAEAADLVQALVDRSLLLVSQTPNTEPRLRMLEGVREFLLRQLDERDERAAAMKLLVAVQSEHWRQADLAAGETPSMAWAEAHEQELPNLRASLRWLEAQGDAEGLVRLMGYTGHLWHRMGIQREGRDWFMRVLPMREAAAPELQARFLAAWAMQAAAAHLLDAGAVIDLLPAAVETLQAAGDTSGAAMAAHATFHLAVRTGRETLRQQALEWQSANTPSTWGLLAQRALRMNRAFEVRMQGDSLAYEAAMRAEIAIARQHQALVEGWVATQALGLALMDQGRAEEASALIEETLREMRKKQMLAHYPALAGVWLVGLGTLHRVELLRRSLPELTGAFLGAGVRFMLYLPAAMLAALEERFEDAARLLGRYAVSQPLKAPTGERGGLQQLTERAHAALHAQLVEQLGESRMAALQEEGRALGDEHALALAVGLDAAASLSGPSH